MSVPRSILQKLGLGKLVYGCWHRPKGFVVKCLKEGPLNLWLSNRGQRKMEQAAKRLPVIDVSTDSHSPLIVFLTGKRFWYQTAYCLHSFLKHTDQSIRVQIIDDGTLGPVEIGLFERLFPGIAIKNAGEIRSRLDEYLPENRFPSLRARRLVYPHLRKLTDVHVGERGWKLVLDSDMLFWAKPEQMIAWLRRPNSPYYLKDAIQSYGYSDQLMTELAGAEVPEKLNVGACGLKSEEIDWERLENWCRLTLEKEGSSYLQEQALSAMLGAGREISVAPPADYIVMPTKADVMKRNGVLHHYVAESKAWYFRFAWKLI